MKSLSPNTKIDFRTLLAVVHGQLYDSDSGSGQQIHTQSSPGERSGKFSQNGRFGQNDKFCQNGKFGQNGMSGQKGKVHLGPKCK